MKIDKLPNVIEWREMPPPIGTRCLFLLHLDDEELRIRWAWFSYEGKVWEYEACKAIAWAEMPTRTTADVIREFVAQVERLAESKMLKTGRLEGAHYAAMKQLAAELGIPGTHAGSKRGEVNADKSIGGDSKVYPLGRPRPVGAGRRSRRRASDASDA